MTGLSWISASSYPAGMSKETMTISFMPRIRSSYSMMKFTSPFPSGFPKKSTHTFPASSAEYAA